MSSRVIRLFLITFLVALGACGDEKKVFSSDEDVRVTPTASGTAAGAGAAGLGTGTGAAADMSASLGPAAAPNPGATGPQPGPSDFSGLDIPLVFRTPDGWVETPATNNMRLHQYRLPRVEGDAEDGEAAVFLFPGAGGTPERNLDRWRDQMKSPEGGAIGDRAVRDQFVHNGHQVWSIDMTGRYATTSMTDGTVIDKPNMRFVGFVIVTASETFFVKCLGPAPTMERWRRSIQDFVLAACAPPRFAARKGFVEEAPSSQMRKAQFRLPRAESESEDATLVVFFFPGGAGSVDQNLERWIGQFVQPDGTPSRERAKIEKETVGSSEITFLDVAGTYRTVSMTDGKQIDEPRQRMIAAIIVDGADSHFVRALGGEKTIGRWREDVLAFVRAAARP